MVRMLIRVVCRFARKRVGKAKAESIYQKNLLEESKNKITDEQNRRLYDKQDREVISDIDEYERIRNRKQALDLIGLGEVSTAERMKELESKEFLHSYLMSGGVREPTNTNRDQEQFYKEEHTNNNRLSTKLDKFSKWGLGGEILKRRENKFKKGEVPLPEEIEKFLKRELIKDVVVVDLHAKNINDRGKWGMIGTGFSNRHIFKVAQNLVGELKSLGVEWNNVPRIFGRRDDEWIMVIVGANIRLHLFTEGQREDVDLESKWDYFNVFLENHEVREQKENEYANRRNPFKFKDLNKD
jgi:ribosomal silencing factor RsfS